jgi:hypothetical protein
MVVWLSVSLGISSNHEARWNTHGSTEIKLSLITHSQLTILWRSEHSWWTCAQPINTRSFPLRCQARNKSSQFCKHGLRVSVRTTRSRNCVKMLATLSRRHVSLSLMFDGLVSCRARESPVGMGFAAASRPQACSKLNGLPVPEYLFLSYMDFEQFRAIHCAGILIPAAYLGCPVFSCALRRDFLFQSPISTLVGTTAIGAKRQDVSPIKCLGLGTCRMTVSTRI